MAEGNVGASDVAEQIAARFGAPLEGCAQRRVVIWHDAGGSFEGEFDRLATEGFDGDLPGGRALRFAKADGVSQFALKKLVYRDALDSDFLVYSRSHKDLSPRGLEGSWLADIGADTAKLGRRYAILDGIETGDTLFVKMNMDDMAGGDYIGLAPRECVRIKKPGPGECYVHGGVSLQELCVPVIRFHNRKGGSKGFVEQQPATLKLLSTSRRVNSMIFRVELFQPEAVGGKVLPAEYELSMTDASGNEVSNVVKAHADMSDADDTARVTRSQFSLKAGCQHSSKSAYYLVCREKDTKQIAWKEEFAIDIAFAPMDDFGF